MNSYQDANSGASRVQSPAATAVDSDPSRFATTVDDGVTTVDPGATAVGKGSKGDEGAHVAPTDRHAVVQREKERYGGIKWGSAFFGWLTATGTAVLLTALLAAAGTVVGVASDTNADEVAGEATKQAETIGLVGGIALLVVLLIAYFCGGYVAGRMARFNGIRQGVAVWVWAVAIAVVVAITGALAGAEFDVLAKLGGFPRLPINEGAVSTGGLIAIVVGVLAALVGAVLGGLAGMRFHRKVDKAGLGH